MSSEKLDDISDTAFWVAAYRAMESERSDALFHDPYAGMLTQERGHDFAKKVSGYRYVAWTVVMRTVVIDKMILTAIKEGVDTILNLGAGLDTRPYRLNLPKDLQWIEVDFPKMIAFKEKKLQRESPKCKLERVSLDLSKKELRQELFKDIAEKSGKVLVLTEGVILYLSENAVAELASDLLAQENFCYWVTEYHSKAMYQFFRSRKKNKEMKNTPFRFFPDHWLGFFHDNGWQEKEITYLVHEAAKRGRKFPSPFWARIMLRFLPKKKNKSFSRAMGFVLWEPMP